MRDEKIAVYRDLNIYKVNFASRAGQYYVEQGNNGFGLFLHKDGQIHKTTNFKGSYTGYFENWQDLLSALDIYSANNPRKLPDEFVGTVNGFGVWRIVKSGLFYISHQNGHLDMYGKFVDRPFTYGSVARCINAIESYEAKNAL